ncbi:MAG: hypothetical protein PSU94_12070 [Lacunisphaera sp.]|nr:hypothetical protein [Lacunisphaera sp.]
MKTTSIVYARHFAAFVAFILVCVTTARADDLGWIERSSVQDILKQFGYPGLTVLEGTKTSREDPKDGPGWYISARCKGKDGDYVARLWIATDWKKGRVISCAKRE